MGIAKRVFLFIATNLAILVTVSLVTYLLGIQPYLTDRGINYESLMAFCLVWGFAGAFISLAISRMIAKWTMGVKVIKPELATGEAAWLVERVHTYAKQAGISKMPEVGIYESPEPNAFATGPTKNRSLVAVSTGLLQTMRREEVEGVLAHEVAHVANGDMVTLTLIQGVVNAFVMFFARIVAHAISMNVREEMRGIVHFVSVLVFDILFGILGSMVVAFFSRWREFRADAGGAQLAGREKMIGALQRLKQVYFPDPHDSRNAMASFKIAGKKAGGFWALLMTHPPLEKRIAALQGN